MKALWFAIALFAVPAWAGEKDNELAQAELMRLTQDLSNLSKRQHWMGVERIYEKILAIDGAEIHYEVHRLAADASRARGDMAATLDRIERAVALEAHEDDLRLMTSLQENFGRVILETTPRRPATLSRDEMPFPPDQRLQIKTAMVACDKEGYFRGMLPLGLYRLDNEIFEVTYGSTIQVELAEAKK
jgi:hypothetical protein